MSPDVFLSRNGIRYDGSGLKGSPAEIVENLMILNSVRSWNGAMNGFVYNQYRTPNFVQGSYGPASFSPANVFQESSAVNSYYLALTSGDIGPIYAAVDTINRIRSKKGGSEFVPPDDFQLYAHMQNPIGEAARFLLSQYQGYLDGNTDVPWFFTRAAFESLNAYNLGLPVEPPQTPTKTPFHS